MRTRNIFRYLLAIIIALGTTANAMAQQRALKIYFSANNGGTAPQILVTDDNNSYNLPANLTVTANGAVWANKARYWEVFQQDVTDRVIAAYTASDKKESKLTLSFVENGKSTMPYEVNMIQWNVMNDLLSSSILDILDNYRILTKCVQSDGGGWSSSDQHWDMNFLAKETSFTQKDVPWAEDGVLNGLKSFEIGEQCWRKSPLGWLFNFQVALDDQCRTFIKAGWNGVTGTGSNIHDNDDENWAFKVKFTLPDIRMRCYSCRVVNNVILGELDNTIIKGESGIHALRGYIAAHAGAVVPTYDPSDIDGFHFEYFAEDPNQIDIKQYTGLISNAMVAGDIPVTVKLMRGKREVSSYTQTIHVMKEDEVRAKIAIGFENGNKGYDITVGDQNAQIKGVFTENANNIAPTVGPNGYHFEYTESSNGQIIAIDKYTGKITAKKEGDVDVSAVLKSGENIISNTYTYTLHVFAQHEGLEFRRINTYHYTTSSNNNSWIIANNTNSSSYEWKSNNLLRVNTSISKAGNTYGVNDWKQIASFSTGASERWRAICQEVAFDVYVPKYTKSITQYSFAGNAAIGDKKTHQTDDWYVDLSGLHYKMSDGSCKYGFEINYLNQKWVNGKPVNEQITLEEANTKLQDYSWNTNAGSVTQTFARSGTSSYTSNVGIANALNREIDNVTSPKCNENRKLTVYFAVMSYLWNNEGYPGDVSIGFKGIPTYTYYSTVTYYMNDGTENTYGTDSYTSDSKTGTDKLYKNPNSDTKPKPTRVGYEFLGWSTNPEATVAEYEYQGQFCPYDDVNGGGKGPVSLYAVWRANTYLVELRNTSTGPVDGYVYAIYDQNMPLVDVDGNAVKAPTKKGYDFGGYYGEAIGQGTKYYNADMSSNHVWDRTETDKNYVIARWYAHKSTVVFDPQGGNNNGASRVTATYDAAMPTEGVQAPQRQGYTFGGYYSKPNGAGTQYYTADMTSARTWDIDERLLDPQVTEVTLYAKWIKVLFTITLDADGGTLDYKEINTWGTILEKNANSLVLQVEKNESKCTDIWCSNRINIKPGYKLLGWYTEPQTEEDAHHHPALHPGTLVYSVDPGNNFSYHFRAVSEEANPKYWNSEKKWVGTDDLTLYAHYEMIFEVENDVITFLDSEPKNCVSGEDLTAALDYAKNHGAKLINTLDMIHPDTGADGKQGEDIMKAFEDAKAEAGSIVSPNALIYFTNTWPQNRKTNAITMNKNGGLCQDLVITDRYSIRIPIEFNAQKATYARDAGIVDDETDQAKNSSWGTLCLPYAIKNKNSHVKLYWLESTANNYMEFEEFDDDAIIPANTPVLYCRTDGKVSSKVTIEEVNRNVPQNMTYHAETIAYANPKEGTYPLENVSETLYNWEFTGNLRSSAFYGKDYNKTLLTGYIGEQQDRDYIYYFKQNKFTRLGDKSSMILYPYRAYFRQVDAISKGAKIAEYSILVIDEDGSTTDITNAIFGDGEGDGKIYDLNGIRVMQPVKGRLYIVNGQKKVYR